MLRRYLILIRLPNVFTAPSNILSGYFATTPSTDANGIHLLSLMISSILLYIAGIVLNDYFDIEIDRKEHPSRPLASGSIKKKHALIIALATLATANMILVAISLVGFAICIALSVVIIAYNYRLKRNAIIGSISMGTARSLNVILGATPALALIMILPAGVAPTILLGLWTLAAAAASLFAYIIAIMFLSRKEVTGNGSQIHVLAFSIVFSVIASIGILGIILNFHPAFLISLSVFAAVMILTFKRYRGAATSAEFVQKTIRNMVLSIILLDSVFVSGTAGIIYGMATMLFIVPAALLAKKMYVT